MTAGNVPDPYASGSMDVFSGAWARSPRDVWVYPGHTENLPLVTFGAESTSETERNL